MQANALRRSWFYPASWPIAVKLAFGLVLASLVPMLLVSYYNLQQGLAIAAEAEASKLEQLAASKGARLDQLIQDTKHAIAYFGRSAEVIQLAARPSQARRKSVDHKMARLMDANSNLELFMVLNRDGVALASSKPEYLETTRKEPLKFRDYFTQSISGNDDRVYVSDLLVGTRSGQPGVYFSLPIRDNGAVIGVAVLKLKEKIITGILEEEGARTQHDVFLVNQYGLIVYHPHADARYRSLAPISEKLQEQLKEAKILGRDAPPIQALNLNALADKMANARKPEHMAYVWPLNRQRQMAGFAPMAQNTWLVTVSESEAAYTLPLRRLFNDAVQSVALVGVVFILLALVFARSFTRPLKALTDAAHAVEEDDLERAMVKVTTRDELGRFAITFNHMVANIQARQRERDIFGRMVSPEVREKLLKGDLKLGGENLRVTVLFSDIRGFSTMSEKMSPQDVVSLLNEYMTEMTEAVRPFGGYVNNFIGDAIVVIFGAPESRSECEWSALQAAMAMKQRLVLLNQRRKYMGDAPIATGIGISTGKVVAGQIGSMERFMYTVIGDAVNVAARLEALTKEFQGNPILMNAVTYEGCKHKEGEVQLVDEGLQIVKGRQEPVHVYAVYGPEESQQP